MPASRGSEVESKQRRRCATCCTYIRFGEEKFYQHETLGDSTVTPCAPSTVTASVPSAATVAQPASHAKSEQSRVPAGHGSGALSVRVCAAPPVPTFAPVIPVVPEISAKDFVLIARTMDLYGRRGNSSQGFYLSLTASAEVLSKIAAVEYWTSSAYRQQGYFRVVSGSNVGISVDSGAFDSMFYPASSGGWKTFPAKVTLRDGRKIEIPGAMVNF